MMIYVLLGVCGFLIAVFLAALLWSKPWRGNSGWNEKEATHVWRGIAGRGGRGGGPAVGS